MIQNKELRDILDLREHEINKAWAEYEKLFGPRPSDESLSSPSMSDSDDDSMVAHEADDLGLDDIPVDHIEGITHGEETHEDAMLVNL